MLFGLVPITVAGPVEVLTLAIPQNPALAGLTLFAQHVALDGTAVVLGNQIATVVP